MNNQKKFANYASSWNKDVFKFAFSNGFHSAKQSKKQPCVKLQATKTNRYSENQARSNEKYSQAAQKFFQNLNIYSESRGIEEIFAEKKGMSTSPPQTTSQPNQVQYSTSNKPHENNQHTNRIETLPKFHQCQLQQAFQRECNDLQSQPQTLAVQEQQHAMNHQRQINFDLAVNTSENIFEQFGKGVEKKAIEVIQILSDSDQSSRINLSPEPKKNPLPPPPPTHHRSSINRPQIILSGKKIIPLKKNIVHPSQQASTNQRSRYQSILKYQLPTPQEKSTDNQNPLLNSHELINLSNYAPQRRQSQLEKEQEEFRSKLISSRGQSKPSSFFPSPRAQPKWNQARDQSLKRERNPPKKLERFLISHPFAAKAPEQPIQLNEEPPFKKIDFYIHITLMPCPKKEKNNKDEQKKISRDTDAKNIEIQTPITATITEPTITQKSDPTTIWASSIKKYKITNSNVKYKQERIDDYFANDQRNQRRKQFIRKIPQPPEEEQNSIKQDPSSKSAKKSSKYPNQNHPLAIQGELQLQNVNYSKFLARRVKKPGEPTDLGVLTIDQIVEQCYVKEVLSQEIYVEYINNISQGKIKSFVRLFLESRMQEWKHNGLKITLMDHRRLAIVLVNIFPQEYVIYEPQSLNKDINDFLVNLYLLNCHQYNNLLQKLDQIAGVTFWTTFHLKYRVYLETPYLIMPFPQKEQKQAEKNCIDSCYTPAEEKMIQSYRGIREKPKETIKKPFVYIQNQEETSEQSQSQSSHSSSEQTYVPNMSSLPEPIKNIIKKSGKTPSKRKQEH